MIKVHCNQLTDFLRIYVLDWHVLCALIIPFLFAMFFPVYWFVICPAVWKTDLSLYRPRSWLIGYWLLASLIWFVFLAICLFHMRNGRKTAMAMKGACLANKSDSTEDLWNEDAYLPESYLPIPDYMVSIAAIQPDMHNWDFDYDSRSRSSLKSLLRPHEIRPYLSDSVVVDGERTPLLPVLEAASDLSRRKMSEQTNGSSRSDSLESDTKFDDILASLQSLALELEKDFDDSTSNSNESPQRRSHDALSLQEYSEQQAHPPAASASRTRSTGDITKKAHK